MTVAPGLEAEALALRVVATPAVRADDYPSRPVKLIVPLGAGGPADLVGRYLGQQLSERMKQSFVIENRPGAGSTIGAKAVADAAPDQASSWQLASGAFWAARANLLAGNPQKFTPYLKRAALHGRTFHGLVAQKVLGMKVVADWNPPTLDKKRTEWLVNDRVGRRALARRAGDVCLHCIRRTGVRRVSTLGKLLLHVAGGILPGFGPGLWPTPVNDDRF